MFGYMGKILRANLTDQKITEEPLEEDTARKFIGGMGLGAKILFDELKPGIDPLGPRNKLIIAPGVLAGLPFPHKFSMIAKSPLTDIYGEATAAGFFAQELKFAGFDAIIIEGKAEKPVYLWIHDGEAEIRDASHLWGKATREVQRLVREEVKDDRAQVGCIGLAGENLVRFASVLFGFNHAAGRTGLGAVMGSKNLKAIAVRGTLKVKLADEEKVLDICKNSLINKEALKGPYWPNILTKFGSLVDLGSWQETGRLPTMNWRKCTFKGANNLTAENLTATILKRINTCPYCPVACNRVLKAHYPYDVDPDYGGLEYECTAALGSLCMVDNLVGVAKAFELCNKYGMDAMTTGVTIAFAMECYEKGLLTSKDTEGLDLTWGNHKSLVQVAEKIAMREGVGDLLAEGVKRASKKIGHSAEEFAMHVKGLEFPLHDVRGMKAHGLGIATSNRGACHLVVECDDTFMAAGAVPEIGLDERIVSKSPVYVGPEKAKLAKICGDLFALFDSLVVCKWTVYPCGGYKVETIKNVVSAATGWDVTIDELMKTGERIFNICRAFNVREGITRKDDTLPKRFAEPLPEGQYQGETFTPKVLEKMLNWFYEFRGWDKKTGIPTREKLEELDLGYVAKELESLGKLPTTHKRPKK